MSFFNKSLTLSAMLSLACFLLLWGVEAAEAQTPDDKEIILTTADGPLIIPLDKTVTVEISPTTGNILATAVPTFTCETEPNCPECPICDDVEVSMSSADGGLFTVNNLTNATVSLNASITMRWASRGAWECSGEDPLGSTWSSGVKLPSGQQNVSLQGFPVGQYTFGIQCRNGDQTASRTVAIEIDDATVVPEGCENRPPPSHLTRSSQCIYPIGSPPDPSCFNYAAVFGDDFPGTTNGRQFYQSPNQYTSFEFNTGNLANGREGQWGVNEPQFGVSATGGKIWTISKCPGDFDRTAIANDPELGSGCYVRPFVSNASIKWGGQNFLGSTTHCGLKPNATYFLNVVYTSSSAGTDPDAIVQGCSGAGDQICGNLFTPSFTN